MFRFLFWFSFVIAYFFVVTTYWHLMDFAMKFFSFGLTLTVWILGGWLVHETIRLFKRGF